MDHAKTLIRSIVRAFHDIRHIIVVDALMVHSTLSVDDLHHLTGLQPKDIRKLLGRLKEDRLVSVQSRQEIKIANNRPIHRDYYYINFHATIDAIKYRVFQLTKKVNDAYKPTEEKKDYFCPRCKARWTQLEVLDKVFVGGFLCHRCDGVLERDEDSAADNIGHKTQSKLMSQLEPFLDLLKQIDTEEVPQNDFQSALQNVVPVTRDSETHPVTIDAASNVKQEVKSVAKQKQDASIEVKVDRVDEESTRAAEEALKQQKAAQEKQNALPTWYTHSTIDGPKLEEATSSAVKAETLNGVKPEEDDKGDLDIKQNSEMEAYFASLRAEKEREAAEEAEADEEEDDDDEDFEDIDIASGMPSGMGTPRSEVSGSLPSGSQTAVNGNGKRHAPDEDSFRNISMSGALGNSPMKRVKVEDSNAASVASTPGDRDSDEDEEFEDAL